MLKFIKNRYEQLKNVLSKSGSLLGNKIRTLFKGPINDEVLDDLEQLFYEADLGAKISHELTQKVKDLLKNNPQMDVDSILDAIRESLSSDLTSAPLPPEPVEGVPKVILVIGVNGNGKTTSTAKLAKLFKDNGKKVIIAAADTYRAAAVDQLELWSQKIGVELVKAKPKSDPAAVVFDAAQAALARKMDIVLIDTAGRLHTKTDLMQELEKIRRVLNKAIPGAPHETWLVLDATIGQNAVDQAKIFHKFTPITGILLTKLDGTAKGGIVISIQKQLNVPIRYVGLGEGEDDLKPFDAPSFIQALFD